MQLKVFKAAVVGKKNPIGGWRNSVHFFFSKRLFGKNRFKITAAELNRSANRVWAQTAVSRIRDHEHGHHYIGGMCPYYSANNRFLEQEISSNFYLFFIVIELDSWSREMSPTRRSLLSELTFTSVSGAMAAAAKEREEKEEKAKEKEKRGLFEYLLTF